MAATKMSGSELDADFLVEVDFLILFEDVADFVLPSIFLVLQLCGGAIV